MSKELALALVQPPLIPRNKTPLDLPVADLLPLADGGPEPTARFKLTIAGQGVLEPVLVSARMTKTGLVLVKLMEGKRRVKAAHAAGFKTVPARIFDAVEMREADWRRVEPTADPQADMVTLSTNFHRSSNAVEELRSLERLTKHTSLEQVAKTTGIPKSMLQRRLRLTRLIPKLRAAWEDNAFPLTVAEACARLHSRQQKKLLDILETEGTVTAADVRAQREADTLKAAAALPDKLFTPDPGDARTRAVQSLWALAASLEAADMDLADQVKAFANDVQDGRLMYAKSPIPTGEAS